VGLIAFALVSSLAAADYADIFNWKTGETIRGTDGIVPYPGIAFVNWNRDDLNLRFADFRGTDLASATFLLSWLDNARFDQANLQKASFDRTRLIGVNLTDSLVAEATFHDATSRGFTKEQLYSTASYKLRDLRGIGLAQNDLSGWDLSRQDLSDASFHRATLVDTNFTDAVIAGASLASTTRHGFTKEQLYSTASYRAKDLQGTSLSGNDVTGWNFVGQNLADASFSNAQLAGADLTDAIVTGTSFFSLGGSFAIEQLYSTASYKTGDLHGIDLGVNDLSAADLRGQNLTGANFGATRLTKADLDGADVVGANFTFTTSLGFGQRQLYSTASYRRGDLHGILLKQNDLSGWDLAGQILRQADFSQSDVMGTDLSRTNLTGADFTEATLRAAIIVDAEIAEADFTDTTAQGFTKEQLYSTASHRGHDLHGVRLMRNDLTGWDFAGQNLIDADFTLTTLTGADFTDARIEGASFSVSRGFTNDILYSTASFKSGDLRGIDLGANRMRGWNLSRLDLTEAGFDEADLTGANLSEARLFGAFFGEANLRDADLSRANLRHAVFDEAGLTGTNLTDAVVEGADFEETTRLGFTKEQLYSTASYKTRTLSRINLRFNDLTQWNLAGQQLTNVLLDGANLSEANLSLADLENASLGAARLDGANLMGANLANANLANASFHDADLRLADLRGVTRLATGALDTSDAGNAILPDGSLEGLDLTASEQLVVRDNDLAIHVQRSMVLAASAALEFVFEDAQWGSTMNLAAGVVPDLGGTLLLSVDSDAKLHDLIGVTFLLFDWNGQLPVGEQFDQIITGPGQSWDVSRLYTTGEVRFLGVPEPSGRELLLFAAFLLVMRAQAWGHPARLRVPLPGTRAGAIHLAPISSPLRFSAITSSCSARGIRR